MENDLEQYVSIQRWYRQLRKRSANMENGGIPKATLAKCVSAITNYMKFTGMTPDELIEDAKKEMRESGSWDKHNEMLDKFWEQYTTKTTAGILFSYIKSFYKRNGIALTTTTPSIPKVRKRDFKLETAHVRATCDSAPLQHKSWIIANNYLGLRIGAVPALTVANFMIENWKNDKPLYPVFIPRNISGTFDYTTFIGNDAMHVLQNYFVANAFDGESHPWNMNKSYLNNQLKKYALDARVIDAPFGVWPNGQPKGINPFHSHIFRKRVQTVLEGAKIPLNWVDHMLGHVPRGAQAKAYSQPSEEDLYDAYLQALPELEIYGHHPLSPTKPNVELQKFKAMDEIGKLNISQEQKEVIFNAMKNIRTETEISETLQNVMVYVRKGEKE